jgi:hypothetical protein
LGVQWDLELKISSMNAKKKLNKLNKKNINQVIGNNMCNCERIFENGFIKGIKDYCK